MKAKGMREVAINRKCFTYFESEMYVEAGLPRLPLDRAIR